MSKKKTIKQGEIYMCDLSFGSIEHEQSGVRPVIVVSCDTRNEASNNVFIFPITHSTKKKFQPCHYKLFKDDYSFFIYKTNTVLCEEGRSISKSRLERKLGEISRIDLSNILKNKEYIFIEKNG